NARTGSHLAYTMPHSSAPQHGSRWRVSEVFYVARLFTNDRGALPPARECVYVPRCIAGCAIGVHPGPRAATRPPPGGSPGSSGSNELVRFRPRVRVSLRPVRVQNPRPGHCDSGLSPARRNLAVSKPEGVGDGPVRLRPSRTG